MAVMDFGYRNSISTGGVVVRPLKALFARIMAYRNYRKARSELEHLTDRELDDLGIARYDIPAIARKPRETR